MEIEVTTWVICPHCGKGHEKLVYIEVDPSDLAQDTYGD